MINDHPVIVAGVAAMLQRDPRIEVVEYAALTKPEGPVDIALFDAFASNVSLRDRVRSLASDERYSHLAVYSWNMGDEQVKEALALGAHGYLGKTLTPDGLADALLRIQEGKVVVVPGSNAPGTSAMVPPSGSTDSASRILHTGTTDTTEHGEIVLSDWPGQENGLSPREAEVVTLITQGLTNDDIARTCYLSINSVKSYIRSAYRKMGVERRSQAVLWGIEHGMLPDKERKGASQT